MKFVRLSTSARCKVDDILMVLDVGAPAVKKMIARRKDNPDLLIDVTSAKTVGSPYNKIGGKSPRAAAILLKGNILVLTSFPPGKIINSIEEGEHVILKTDDSGNMRPSEDVQSSD